MLLVTNIVYYLIIFAKMFLFTFFAWRVLGVQASVFSFVSLILGHLNSIGGFFFMKVLIGKAKIEGEEELRKVVVALNGLAGIAIIEGDNTLAISLYKEALTLADEHHGDFGVDPLLNLHINHNLAELLRNSPEYLPKCPLTEKQNCDDVVNGKRKETNGGNFDRHNVKRRKKDENKTYNIRMEESGTSQEANDDDAVAKFLGSDAKGHSPTECYSDECMKRTCEMIIEKHLSTFGVKLSSTQLEFRTSFEQVATF